MKFLILTDHILPKFWEILTMDTLKEGTTDMEIFRKFWRMTGIFVIFPKTAKIILLPLIRKYITLISELFFSYLQLLSILFLITLAWYEGQILLLQRIDP